MAGNSKNKRKPSGVRLSNSTSTPIAFRQSEEVNFLIKIRPYFPLERFRENTASWDDWVCLYLRIQTGVEIARKHFASEDLATLLDASIVLYDVKYRYDKSNYTKMEMDSDEINNVVESLQLTDLMQDNITRKQLADAYVKIQKEHIVSGNLKVK